MHITAATDTHTTLPPSPPHNTLHHAPPLLCPSVHLSTAVAGKPQLTDTVKAAAKHKSRRTAPSGVLPPTRTSPGAAGLLYARARVERAGGAALTRRPQRGRKPAPRAACRPAAASRWPSRRLCRRRCRSLAPPKRQPPSLRRRRWPPLPTAPPRRWPPPPPPLLRRRRRRRRRGAAQPRRCSRRGSSTRRGCAAAGGSPTRASSPRGCARARCTTCTTMRCCRQATSF
mmetsp:Transcript_51351/g.162341  ORF Transcript_51351/g.162341 Transcript_51351/m.162341 type:complete len:229 (-) Transcript_51351:634-1320(-)